MARSNQTKYKRPRKPPLSATDRWIYNVGFVLFFVLIFVLIILFRLVEYAIVKSIPGVIAYDFPGEIWTCPFLVYYMFSFSAALGMTLDKKMPIFGNPKIAYGQSPWERDFYPLLDPRHKKAVSPSKRSFQKKAWILWGAGLFITILLALNGLGRIDCLYQDNRIVSYHLFSQRVEAVYHSEDYRHVSFVADVALGQYDLPLPGTYKMRIDMPDGKMISFGIHRLFHGNNKNHERLLQKMLEIKHLAPPESISITGANHVQWVADERHLNERETGLLEELFETTEG